ncbi:MAG: SDR family NAD(P)-dependent oxidoreductase [Myxococcota bacterium]
MRGVIVSGGSRGLGLAIVRRCLSEGYAVSAFARSATAEMRALEEELPERFTFSEVDGRDERAVAALVRDATERFELWGLVNNAAVGQDHLLCHLPLTRLRDIVDIDIVAPMVLTRAVVKRMLLNEEGGRIVNISSICGSRGYPGLTVYSAAKGALDAFTRSLAREVGSRRILVNSVAPGFFSSEMSEVLTDEQMQVIVRRTPTQSLCTADDITPVVAQLLFHNRNVTGQTLVVDGGAIT